MLKAILFDLDGTLIDWSGFTGDWETNEARYLRRVFDFVAETGSPLPDFLRFKAEYIQRTREAWNSGRSNLRAPHLGKVLVETLEILGTPHGKVDMQSCLDAYQGGAVAGTHPFPDAFDVLTQLTDRGLRLGIITNAFQPMSMRDLELEQHGLLEHFPECRISAADVGYLKPHPKIFEAGLSCLGIRADEAIFVGDNPVADIAGAQGAGLRAVMILSQAMPTLISGIVVPDFEINALAELLPLLDNLS